jgi:hypothetical protein
MRTAIEWNMENTAIGSFIAGVVTDYAKLSDRLHAASIMAFVHGAEHGDPVHLNTFFSGLRENDQNMLKAWLLKFSSYTNIVGGEEVRVQWIGFRSKEGKKGEAVGFFIKPKTEAVRKGKFIPQDMYEGEAFFDTADKPAKPMTLAAILAMLSKLDGKVTKDEEKATEQSEAEVHIPADLRDLIKTLSAKAELELAVAKAVKPANVIAAPATQQ